MRPWGTLLSLSAALTVSALLRPRELICLLQSNGVLRREGSFAKSGLSTALTFCDSAECFQ